MGSLGTKYRLGPQIGGGGMAEVYRGTIVGAEGFTRPVAIKRIHASFSSDPRFASMFVNEARIASLLQHPNICSVLDFDRDDDQRFYLVMELVEGVDLHALMHAGPVPVDLAVHVAAEVLAGLDHAHELVRDGKKLKIVHRDVSPHNIMLSWTGSVKLVDFGIAKAVAATNASQSGALKGKVGYMSPEQAQGGTLDGRSDVFAVGVVLHEMLAGRRLFSGPSEPAVLARVLGQPIPRPGELSPAVGDDLDAIVMAMLERDLSRRFSSARAALEALLTCRASTARGALDLRDLLTRRFPDRAIGGRTEKPLAIAETLPAALQTTLAERPQPPKPEAAAPLAKTWTAPREPALEKTEPEPAPATRSARTGLILTVAGVASIAVIASAFLYLRDPGAQRSAERNPNVAPAPVAPDPGAAPPVAEAPAAEVVIDAGSVPDAAHGEPEPSTAPPAGSAKGARSKKTVSRSDPKDDTARGSLRIIVKPWAEVRVDGSPRGMAPLSVRLAPGKHEIVLSNPSLAKRETVSVTIEAHGEADLVRDWR